MNSVERSDRFLLGARARVIEDSKEVAWAEKHVRFDPDIKWILGNFVEAENPNENGHIFPLADLTDAVKSIASKPLNMLHHGDYIVGAFAAAEMVWPTSGGPKVEATSAVERPFVEALSAFWRHQFPEEYDLVQRAHDEGALYYSMEAIPQTLNCTVDGCQFKETPVAYDGRTSDTYCDHMNAPRGQKILNKPNFGAGALIIPPVRPGWKKADISELTTLLNQVADEAEAVYAQLQVDLPHLDARSWESMMHLIMLQARDFDTERRQKLAKEGKAMPDGSYPIENIEDLKNAIQAVGRAPDAKRSAVRQHIMKRAKALGHPELIPKDWQ